MDEFVIKRPVSEDKSSLIFQLYDIRKTNTCMYPCIIFITSCINGHAKTCLRAYADSEGPDQPAHSHSLIRAFVVRKQNHWLLQNVSMESKCLDETVYVQDDVNPHILRMLEATGSFDAAQMMT